jgi:hypothetical protein
MIRQGRIILRKAYSGLLFNCTFSGIHTKSATAYSDKFYIHFNFFYRINVDIKRVRTIEL